jgi:glyoxylase-like metal-dependent hydrolase (beta-lactamase superfamily II)
MIQIAPHIWRIPLGFVNAYFIEHPQGPILVDCGSPGDEHRITAALATRNVQLHQLTMLIGTHLHYDHVGSLPALQHLGAPAATMHPVDAEATQHGIMMRNLQLTPPLNIFQSRFDSQDMSARTNPPALVIPTATHGARFYDDIEVIHTPGHTAGHISLLWHAHGGVLIAGDAFTNFMGLWYAVGHEDATQAAQSRQLLGQYTYAIAVVGHGRPLRKHASHAVAKRFGAPITRKHNHR